MRFMIEIGFRLRSTFPVSLELRSFTCRILI